MNEITVIGLGYVGLTTATLLANSGYIVHAIDIDEERLESARKGKSFFYEEGLDPLIECAVKSGRLKPTSRYSESVKRSSFIFSCVGTPDNPDGSTNLSHVFQAAAETSKNIQPGSIYIQKSTVPVGTGKSLRKLFGDKDIDYLSNPEFLREGSALFDSLFFDRVVIGGENEEAISKVMDLYVKIEESKDLILDISKLNFNEERIKTRGRYIKTGLDSAELIKVTANAFLALKISFANSMAMLADKSDADILEVMEAVGADHRIGRDFLNAGRGYGGGCFPKDVSGLISSASSQNVDITIMNAVQEVNKNMPKYIVDKAKKIVGGEFEKKRAAVLGLSFKAGTSDSRQSPGIKIANILDEAGLAVSAFDPRANINARKSLNGRILISDSVDKAISGADIIFLTTNWPEFKSIDFKKIASLSPSSIIFDCMNFIDPLIVEDSGLIYVGIGRKAPKSNV